MRSLTNYRTRISMATRLVLLLPILNIRFPTTFRHGQSQAQAGHPSRLCTSLTSLTYEQAEILEVMKMKKMM